MNMRTYTCCSCGVQAQYDRDSYFSAWALAECDGWTNKGNDLYCFPQCPKCSHPKDDEIALEHVDPFKTQVGGSHYKDYKIQPYTFFYRNNIPHHKAAIIRRILRYDHPTGKGEEDLDKITHEVELIKQMEGWG